MELRLTVTEGSHKGDVFPIKQGATLIGRSHSADVRFRQPDISARHLQITRFDDNVVVENLSRFGTLLDGQPVAEPVAMRPGQKLTIGKDTVLVLDVGVAEDREKTEQVGDMTIDSETAPMDASRRRAPTFSAVTAAGSERTSGVSRSIPLEPREVERTDSRANVTGIHEANPALTSLADQRAPGSEVETDSAANTHESDDISIDGTRELRTRIPASDEIEFLRDSLRKQARNRVLTMVGGVALLLGAMAIFWPRNLPPEESIEWPQAADGSYLEGYRKSSFGGFDLVYPNTHAKILESGVNRVVIACRVGRERDVPLTFFLEERRDARFVSEDRATTIERWKREAVQQEGRWVFDQPVAMPLFIGRENGIPVVCIPYRRIDQGDWCGTVRILRAGDRLITLRTETPGSERARMDNLLYTFFLRPTTAFEREYWEGASNMSTASARRLVDEAERELRRDAPATWVGIKESLCLALRRSFSENEPDLAAKASALLADLREKQAIWFNAQSLARTEALRAGNEAAAKAGAGGARAVFSDPGDRRYHEVRKW